MDTISSTLQWPDYFIIGVVLSVSIGIGIYYRFTGGRQRTSEEYFSADRSMSIVPLAIALTVSFMSAITLLGITAENYIYGTQFLVIYISAGIAMFLSTYLYLPVFFELQMMSVYQYLEKRFGTYARSVAGSACYFHLLLYTGIVLFAPSLALEATCGVSSTTSVLLIGLICTFYSTIGGIKAVLITDVFQAGLMFASVVAVLVVASDDIEGGLSKVWSIAQEGNRIDFSDFRLDPTIRHTWWSLLIGGTCMFLSMYAVNQVQIQRLLTVKDLKSSQRALILNWPIMLALAGVTSFAGLVLYAVYKDCDPISSGKLTSYDKIMPFFAAERMSRVPGLNGLFVSGIFSATLSTISALLNSLAAIALEDYIKPLCRKIGKNFPDEKATLIGKMLAFTIGGVCILVAFLARGMGRLIDLTISIGGTTGGPLLGIFTLGMFFESPNEGGAITGILSGLVFGMWIVFGRGSSHPPTLSTSTAGCDNFTVPLSNETIVSHSSSSEDNTFYLYRISYMYITPLGAIITISIGYLSSIIFHRIFKENRDHDPNLFTPFIAAKIRRRRENAEKTTSSQVFVLENNMPK